MGERVVPGTAAWVEFWGYPEARLQAADRWEWIRQQCALEGRFSAVDWNALSAVSQSRWMHQADRYSKMSDRDKMTYEQETETARLQQLRFIP